MISEVVASWLQGKSVAFSQNQLEITAIQLFLLSDLLHNNLQTMEVISAGPFNILPPVALQAQDSTRGLQWPKQDLIKYAVFINFQLNIQDKVDEVDFNSWSFYRKLSMFVQSKNPNQCRIHHKKMIKHHSSINSLVAHLRSSIHKFQEWYNHYESVLYNLRSCLLREKQECQQYQPVGTNKINLQINSDPFEKQQLASDKKVDEIPTNASFVNEDLTCQTKSIKPQRRSFNPLDIEDQFAFSENFNFFDRRAVVDQQKISMMKPSRLLRGQEIVEETHKSLMNYLEKLSVFRNSSVYDY